MKMKKILMFIFILMISLFSINASLNDNLEFSSHFNDNTVIDWSGNGNNGNVFVTSATTDKNNLINKSIFFNSISSRIEIPDSSDLSFANGQNFSFTIWFKRDTTDIRDNIFGKGNFATGSEAINYEISIFDQKIQFRYKDTSGVVHAYQSTITITDTNWHMMGFKFIFGTGNSMQLYLDDSTITGSWTSGTGNSIPQTNTLRADVGCGRTSTDVTTNFYDGKLDEPRLWRDLLSNDDFLEVFNLYDGEGISTPRINHNTQDFYNTTNIDLILNTTTNSNYSIYVDDILNQTINDVNATNITITNLSVGQHNFTFVSTDINGQINSTASTIIDLTAPIIQVLQNLTTDSFFINFSNAINVTDNLSGLKSCTINITYLSSVQPDSNFLINCTDTQLFTRAGVYNGFVRAEDNAGNINTLSANGTINPIINIFFAQTNGSIIFNYTPTIFHPDGRITFPEIQPDGNIQLSPVNDGEIDFGIHIIRFEKIGFLTQNFTQVVNSTNAGINITFNASNSIINLLIRDKSTGSIISGPTFSIDFVATVGLLANTNTGNLSVSNIFFLNEEYRVDIVNSLYKTESIFFTFSNQEELNVVSYMSLSNDSTIGFVTIKVSDRFGNPLSGVKVEALQWDSTVSNYIPVSQQKTDEKGLGVLNIILDDELYKFRATLDGLQIESVDQRITESENGKEIPLRLSSLTSEENYILENVLTVVTEDFNESTNISIITFSWEDLTGISQTVCINAFRITNGAETKLTNDTSQCVQGVSGTLIRAFLINSSYTTNIKAQIKIEEDYIKVRSFPHYSTFSISNIITDLKLTQYATPILFIIAMTLGFATNIYLGTISLVLASIGSIWITPTVFNGSVVVFFIFVGIVTLSGGKKP